MHVPSRVVSLFKRVYGSVDYKIEDTEAEKETKILFRWVDLYPVWSNDIENGPDKTGQRV